MGKSNEAFIRQEEKFFDLVRQERMRQDERWGEQNHNIFVWLSILGEEKGEVDKACLEAYFSDTYLGHRLIVEREIVQVAAVAMAMWESLQRNGFVDYKGEKS